MRSKGDLPCTRFSSAPFVTFLALFEPKEIECPVVVTDVRVAGMLMCHMAENGQARMLGYATSGSGLCQEFWPSARCRNRAAVAAACLQLNPLQTRVHDPPPPGCSSGRKRPGYADWSLLLPMAGDDRVARFERRGGGLST